MIDFSVAMSKQVGNESDFDNPQVRQNASFKSKSKVRRQLSATPYEEYDNSYNELLVGSFLNSLRKKPVKHVIHEHEMEISDSEEEQVKPKK